MAQNDSGIIAAIIGLCGTIVAAIITSIVENYHRKKSLRIATALEMHKEFESDIPYRHRCGADKWLNNNQEGLIDDIYKRSNPIDMEDISYVINFYWRLYQSAKYKQVDKIIIFDLFARNFIWWHIHFFEKKLIPSSWTRSIDFRMIYGWFEETSISLNKHGWFLEVKKEYEEMYSKRFTSAT